MAETVSVAIPIRDGARWLDATLAAVRRQRGVGEVDLVVCDSGSGDGSVAIARRHGARVSEIPPAEFSHGETRNRLMREAHGDRVAFLTQDAEPAGDRWLATLLEGFSAAEDVALVSGPYLPRPGASPMVRRELGDWFARMAPVTRGGGRGPDPGPAGFFSDVNGAVARWAWQAVPYRPVAYAEDRLLAADVLARGWAVAFRSDAGVLHSHDYPPVALARRAFDEGRALREVYGHTAPASPLSVLPEAARAVRGDVRAAGVRWAPRSAAHHLLRAAGAAAGARAGRLPPRIRRALSLERRATFEPLAWPSAEQRRDVDRGRA